MPLANNHVLGERRIFGHTSSIGATPVTAYISVPFRCRVLKLGALTQGTITTADATCATTVNGTAITGGSITVTVSGAAAGQTFTATPTAVTTANEDDYISFPFTGASGANIPAQVFAVVVPI